MTRRQGTDYPLHLEPEETEATTNATGRPLVGELP
jgi:hypothetical protein